MADNKIIKQIIDKYLSFPADEESIFNFSTSMFQKIDLYRIKALNVTDEDSEDATQMNESHCHAFYRILGLPIVSSNGTDFYNTGYYGSQMTNDENRIATINASQHANLKQIEEKRERIAFENGKLFLGKDQDALIYKYDMLAYPRSINILQEIQSPFAPDKQKENINGRTGETEVYHVLRPFKCNSLIAAVDKVKISKKNLAAPFFENNVSSDIMDYQKTYLETVCRIRLSKPLSSQDSLIKNLLDKISSILTGSGQNIFENVIKNPSIIETYSVDVLTGMFIKTVLLYSEKIKEHRNLASKLAIDANTSTALSSQIATLETNLSYYTAIQNFIPQEPSYNRGHAISTQNIHNGAILSEFISIISSPADRVQKQLDEAKKQLENHRREALNINESRFYLSGEVLGIGTIDILAMMIAFWAVSHETLVSFLDDSAFNRLYNGRNNISLRDEAVISRHNNQQAPKTITEAIGEFDTIVYNLLSLASSIIEYNTRESSSS